MSYHTSNPNTASAIDRSLPDVPPAKIIDELDYMATHPPPDYLPQFQAEVEAFILKHKDLKIVLVTSGGTTVPLENNTVRFIDNFSAGTRGSTSAEYFLKSGYAVIFLHREYSLLPFSRHYSHTTNCFLDYMTITNDKIEIDSTYSKEMLQTLKEYTSSKSRLLLLPFTTVNQYLHSLKIISILLQLSSSYALFYLAAAVSDFYLPQSKLPQHKIQLGQTNNGILTVNLEQVPKFLSRLVENWAPTAMIVSFKLETDSSILIKKSISALQKYNHQLVIGNLLQTRKNEVVLVTLDSENWVKLSKNEKDHGIEIESKIIPEVLKAHETWIKKIEEKK